MPPPIYPFQPPAIRVATPTPTADPPASFAPALHVDRCKSCNAEIVFIRHHETGNPMPCNAAVVTVYDAAYYRTAGGRAPSRLVVRDDVSGLGKVESNPAPGTKGHVTHYATCPAAHAHRRAKGTRETPPTKPDRPVQGDLFA